jgi:hypothetical protein
MSHVLSRFRLRLIRQKSNDREVNFTSQNNDAWWRYYYAHKQVTGEHTLLPSPKSQPLRDIANEQTTLLPAQPQQERNTSGNHDLHVFTLPKTITDAIDPANLPFAIVLNPQTAHVLSAIERIQEGHFTYYGVLIDVLTSTKIPINTYHFVMSSLELLAWHQ